MIRDVPFFQEHYERFVSMQGSWISLDDLLVYSTFGNTQVQTLLDTRDLAVLAFVGMMEIRAGVAEVWLIPSQLVSRRALSFFKAVKRLLELAAQHFQLRRMQMTIDSTKNVKWAQKLGFSYEASLKNYGHNGETEMLFVRFF